MKAINLHQDLLVLVSERKDGNIDYRFGAKSNVSLHRSKLWKSGKIDPRSVVEMEQIHGASVQVVADPSTTNPVPKVDGLITAKNSVALLVRTADCIPAIIYDPVQKVVALLHIGWRGALQKIHLHALLTLTSRFRIKLSDCLVWLGPSIQKCCCLRHEIPMQAKLPEWEPFIQHTASGWSIDYASFIAHSFKSAGIPAKQITTSPDCTYHNENYFSYKRHCDQDTPDGRFATIVRLK